MTQDEYTALVAETEGHTPGPWRVVHGESNTCEPLVSIIDANGECVADNERYYPEPLKSEHARLIAAAPALLAEVGRLREALAKYADPGIYAPHPHGPAFDDRDLSWIARQALKGGPP
jgi:hypothetical protein